MTKYCDFAVVFQEIPDEITLAIEITNCPHRCAECHSPWLRDDIGSVLDDQHLQEMLDRYPYVTCVGLMGGDADHKDIVRIANWVHENTDKKVAMYSGDEEIDDILIPVLDYYKVGPYIKEKGPLDNKNTNQRLYYIKNNILTDITYKFIKDIK